MSTQEAATTELVPYKWIEEQLRAKVQDGAWLPGAKLPSRRDLAAEYGVAVGTVQRAISSLLAEGILSSDGPRGTFVSVKTDNSRQAYSVKSPELASASARLGVHVTIGVIAFLKQGMADKMGETITNSVERSITRAGGITRFYSLCRPDDSFVTTEQAVAVLIAEKVDAIVLIELSPNQLTQAAALAEGYKTPLIVIAARRSSNPLTCTFYDNQDAGYQAAQHLLERGCADLLFFSPYTCEWVQDRMQGARQAIESAGMAVDAMRNCISDKTLVQVLYGEQAHTRAGYEAACILLTEGMPAKGIIAANDLVALGFIQAASEMGLKAGKDFAIVGFDDHPEAREAGLSTLHPPLEALGQEAGRLVLRALSGDNTPVQVCLHSHLVSRASSRMPFSVDRFRALPDTAPAYVHSHKGQFK